MPRPPKMRKKLWTIRTVVLWNRAILLMRCVMVLKARIRCRKVTMWQLPLMQRRWGLMVLVRRACRVCVNRCWRLRLLFVSVLKIGLKVRVTVLMTILVNCPFLLNRLCVRKCRFVVAVVMNWRKRVLLIRGQTRLVVKLYVLEFDRIRL